MLCGEVSCGIWCLRPAASYTDVLLRLSDFSYKHFCLFSASYIVVWPVSVMQHNWFKLIYVLWVNEDRQIQNYLAKETSIDWPCFETWQTFAWKAEWKINQQDGEEIIKCTMIWQMMVALLHSNGQRGMETERKDVKNLLYSRKDYWWWSYAAQSVAHVRHVWHWSASQVSQLCCSQITMI